MLCVAVDVLWVVSAVRGTLEYVSSATTMTSVKKIAKAGEDESTKEMFSVVEVRCGVGGLRGEVQCDGRVLGTWPSHREDDTRALLQHHVLANSFRPAAYVVSVVMDLRPYASQCMRNSHADSLELAKLVAMHHKAAQSTYTEVRRRVREKRRRVVRLETVRVRCSLCFRIRRVR